MRFLQVICSFLLVGITLGFSRMNWPWQIKSCNELPANTPSGLYKMRLVNGEVFTVYCEMGINDGGYTFIPREMISALSADDVGQIFKNQSNVLLRISRPDGSQPYTVVTSLINKPLTVLSSAHENDKPVNIDTIGAPYVYLNTLSSEDMKDNGGYFSNGKSINYTNCDVSNRNQFVFFQNPNEKAPSSYHLPDMVFERQGMAVDWRKSAIHPPSGSRMPLNFFLFTEMHFGGCGTYTSSDRWMESASKAFGTAIGLK